MSKYFNDNLKKDDNQKIKDEGIKKFLEEPIIPESENFINNENNINFENPIEVLDEPPIPKKKKSKKAIIIIIILLIVVLGLGIKSILSSSDKRISAVDNIIDVSPPSFNEVSIYSNNKNNKKYASRGDDIILKFKADESLKNNPKVLINNTETEVQLLDGYYYAIYNVLEQYEEDFLISFSIYDYQDNSGNKGLTRYNTTDDSSVHIIAKDSIIEKVNVDSISLQSTNLYIKVGNEKTIQPVVKPPNANYDSITWISDDNNIATVDDGVIKAKNIGTTKIYAIIENHKASMIVNVVEEELRATKLSFDNMPSTIYVGETTTIKTKIEPYNTTNSKVTWSSSDESIATITDGLLLAKKAGKVKITAKIDNLTTTQEIIVKEKNIELEKISINVKSKTMVKGSNYQLSASVTPLDYNTKDIKWSSSNSNVVSVSSNGKITAKSKGSATITVSLAGKKATAKITVVESNISVEKFTITASSKTINIGEKYAIIYSITPNNATNQKISWKSSNSKVATVDSNGIVTGIKEGNTTITGTTEDGNKTASIILTVIKPYVSVSSVKLNKTSGTKLLNSSNLTVQLTPTISPSNATNKNVTWSSSNTNVATVSSSGLVTATSPGTANITVKTENGNKTATYTITVKKKVVIIIGASQVTKMNDYVTSWTSSSNLNYQKSNGTLNFINQGSTGYIYQTTTGLTKANTIIKNYSSTKDYVEFYVFFPLSGNDIKNYKCSGISTSTSSIKTIAKSYNDAIKTIKSSGYTVNGFVTSVQPVRIVSGGVKSAVINTNTNACAIGYRSNKKYYKFNRNIKTIIEDNYSTNLKYQSLFSKIMDTSEETYKYKYADYKTTDSIHWDENTTIYYVDLMLSDTSVL